MKAQWGHNTSRHFGLKGHGVSKIEAGSEMGLLSVRGGACYSEHPLPDGKADSTIVSLEP
jgi:hypothetical protein